MMCLNPPDVFNELAKKTPNLLKENIEMAKNLPSTVTTVYQTAQVFKTLFKT